MFKKLCFSFGALMLALCGIENVYAETYTGDDFITLITNATPITADDTLTVGDSTYIGADGAFTIQDGTVTFSLDVNTKRILMTVDGNVTLNEGEKFFIKVPDALEETATQNGITGFSLSITENGIFDINGTVIIPNKGNGAVTNEGIINVNGAVELRSQGYYSASGKTNVSGIFAIYGVDGTNLDATSMFVLTGNGAVYSDYNLPVQNVSSGESGMQVVVASVREYDSVTESVVTASGDNTFAYGYELDTIEDTTIPDEDTTEPDNNVDTPEETTDITNPNTFDGIVSSIIVVACCLSVIAGTTLSLRKRANHH